MPEKSAYSTAETGRATRGAANALLAKAHLYQGNWAECRSACEDVVNSGEYFLDPNYGSIFTEAGENGPGSIWEIQYANNTGGNWGAQFWSDGSYTNVFQRARGTFSGYGFNLPTQDFVDEFEVWEEQIGPDLIEKTGSPSRLHGVQTRRQRFGLGRNHGGRHGRTTSVLRAQVLQPCLGIGAFWRPQPQRRVERPRDSLRRRAVDACRGVQSLWRRRHGDCVVEHGSFARATVPALDGLSGQTLLNAIWHERRVELGLEGHRFFDLVRQERAAQLLDGFVPGKSELFPIPTAEITLSNGQLTQNPGYE